MELRPLSRRLLVLTLAAVSLPAAAAKSLNKHALQQQLERKVFLLRGRYACAPPSKDNTTGPSIVVEGGGKFISAPVATPQGPLTCTLRFNEEGHLQNTAAIAPFSLSAIYVSHVDLRKHFMLLVANEATIVRLSKAKPLKLRAVLLGSQMLKIRIAIDRSKPTELQKALLAIFAGSIQRLLETEPPGKRKADIASLPLFMQVTESQADLDQTKVGWPPTPVEREGPKDGVTAPRTIYQPPPDFPQEGSCNLQFVVDAQGFPQNIRVVHCSSAGFARSMITTVSEFRYRPATQNGKPVPVIQQLKLHIN